VVVRKIQKLRNRKERYRIFFEDGTTVDVNAWTIAKFGIRVGDTIAEKTLNELIYFDNKNLAKDCALNYLSYRVRSSYEVRQHLLKKGFTKDIAIDVIKDLSDLEMLNDVAFARMYLNDQLKRKPQGINLLRQRLLSKGIQQKTIDALLNECVSTKDQQSAATALIKKKISTLSRKKLSSCDYRKLYAYLYSRGFSPEIIRSTLQQFFFGNDIYDSE